MTPISDAARRATAAVGAHGAMVHPWRPWRCVALPPLLLQMHLGWRECLQPSGLAATYVNMSLSQQPIHRAEEIPHLTLGTWKRPYLGVCVILEWLGSASSTVGNSRTAEEAVLRPSRPLTDSSPSSLSERNATEGILGGGVAVGDDALCTTAPLLGGTQQHGEKVDSRELPRVASFSNSLRDAACKHYALNFKREGKMVKMRSSKRPKE